MIEDQIYSAGQLKSFVITGLVIVGVLKFAAPAVLESIKAKAKEFLSSLLKRDGESTDAADIDKHTNAILSAIAMTDKAKYMLLNHLSRSESASKEVNE